MAEEAQNRVSAPAPRYNERYNSPYNRGTAPIQSPEDDKFPTELDSGITVKGILEVMAEGYGFIRSDNYMPEIMIFTWHPARFVGSICGQAIF